MDVPAIALRLCVLLFAALLVACGNVDRPTRSQNARVNALIETVEAQDGQALQDMIQVTSLPCTNEPASIERPRCQGEPPGTNVEVFQVNECEAGWVRSGDLELLFDEVVALDPAVYAAFETPEAFYLQGRYAVIFEGNETRVDEAGLKRYVAIGIEADSGLITGIALGCGIDEPAHFLLRHQNEGFDGWLIEPP